MIEKIKENWRKRIERNAFKSDLTWTDKKGRVHKELVYFKRSQTPFLDIGDWNRIYPPVSEYNKISWANFIFGGKKNLIKLIAVATIVGMVLFEFNHLFRVIETLKELIPPQILIG